PEICPPGEGMHLLSRCSVGRPWGALVLVSGPAAFALVQLGGHRVVVSVDVRGRAPASLGLAIPATCLPGEGGLFRVNEDGAVQGLVRSDRACRLSLDNVPGGVSGW
ncbi:MAG: hypothetical protein LC808_20870, partial [Actinobacteria bacterium]|nr:hypothetical protein [Actinomycetota bacterium]